MLSNMFQPKHGMCAPHGGTPSASPWPRMGSVSVLDMVVVQYYCLLKRPFFAKKTLTFAKLSRTLCFSFAGVHHVMKPFNLVGTRFLNTSARSVFGSAGGCYRQESGVGAEFRWHMLLEKAFAQGRWMMKFVGLLWATGFLWSRFIRRNLRQTFRETLAK